MATQTIQLGVQYKPRIQIPIEIRYWGPFQPATTSPGYVLTNTDNYITVDVSQYQVESVTEITAWPPDGVTLSRYNLSYDSTTHRILIKNIEGYSFDPTSQQKIVIEIKAYSENIANLCLEQWSGPGQGGPVWVYPGSGYVYYTDKYGNSQTLNLANTGLPGIVYNKPLFLKGTQVRFSSVSVSYSGTPTPPSPNFGITYGEGNYTYNDYNSSGTGGNTVITTGSSCTIASVTGPYVVVDVISPNN